MMYDSIVISRFETKFSKGPGCWLWTGWTTPKGYGYFGPRGGKKEPAHRIAYRLYKGAIGPGLHIDHTCRTRNCVNPAHLEAVTPAENNLRTSGVPGSNFSLVTCHRGHQDWKTRKSGQRYCAECNRAMERERHRRRVLAAQSFTQPSVTDRQ